MKVPDEVLRLVDIFRSWLIVTSTLIILLCFLLQLCQHIRYVSSTDTVIGVHWIIKVQRCFFWRQTIPRWTLHHSDLRQRGGFF